MLVHKVHKFRKAKSLNVSRETFEKIKTRLPYFLKDRIVSRETTRVQKFTKFVKSKV